MARAKSSGKDATAGMGGPVPPAAEEERRRMIAEAAYYRALNRGFRGGDPVDDWLAAEREISRLLPSPRQQKQELAAYETLRGAVRKILSETRNTLSADTIRQALDQAIAQLKQLGGHTADTVDKVAATVEKDMVNAAQKIGPKVEAFSEKTADLFQVWRDRSQQFLANATRAMGDWLHQAAGRMKPQIYRTGEMASGGTLECIACGERVALATPAHVPPCPKCRRTEFRRV